MRLTPEREKEIRDHWAKNLHRNGFTFFGYEEILAEIDALRSERDEARKFYGPAGLRTVSSYIDENKRLRDALEKIAEIPDWRNDEAAGIARMTLAQAEEKLL